MGKVFWAFPQNITCVMLLSAHTMLDGGHKIVLSKHSVKLDIQLKNVL